ncbi:MAG: glycosyltransferase family 39 protein [Planctomycetes bacterium]|nr:glycosyltransferase family 39 protein [Planctomycetota bacterium]
MPLSGPSIPKAEPTPAWAWRILAVVTMLGAFLRFYELGKESFWLDEFFSRDVAVRSFSGMIERLSSGFDLHPPASHFILHLCIQALGDTEWVLRLPAAVFGTLAIPMAFLVGRRLYSHREGLLSAALLAVLWWPVDGSRNARPYALLIFASGLSAWLFWRHLDRLLKSRSGAGRAPWPMPRRRCWRVTRITSAGCWWRSRPCTRCWRAGRKAANCSAGWASTSWLAWDTRRGCPFSLRNSPTVTHSARGYTVRSLWTWWPSSSFCSISPRPSAGSSWRVTRC